MGIRSLVSFGLIAVPIGATLGVLIGLDAHRSATGQQPLFQDNSVSIDTYCQKAYGITPRSLGQQYTLNPNQWGWDGQQGGLCMNITQHNNYTYATPLTAPKFSVTWQYPQGPITQPVHAFPNIKIDGQGSIFPASISTIANIPVDVEWTYGLGEEPANITDVAGMTAANVNTNVAIDMFLDDDMNSAQSTTQAKYEIMVWLCTIGASTEPIGLALGAVSSQVINGTTFNLYSGTNSIGQYVLTWVASQYVENFVGDIAPLITSIPQIGRAEFPSTSTYLGYMGLGSEALWTPETVTFDVSYLSIDIQHQ
ncbi:hypothetical protein LTS08_007533 [Lithohypha guttulata]|uniref:xyloglucan-specific endo-beta-1,4-glucanase n=1 Tax=Lithohypha guttulata TaxID=1690604 RepID=A0AAN7SVV0_9EURO|nr:hypothetical protein LTR51_002664 [Lithohypha guttulata]KAK5082847.1 hypothetical protein LTR05_006728 [Lithohypha guttulata]KAK5096660.1 hypothetical protein LTS08_007533 [Lithohypha guttulata]